MNREETISHQEMAELARLRSQTYGFLGSLYIQRPDPAFVGRLTDGAMISLLNSMTCGEASGEIASGLELVKRYLTRIREMPAQEIETELAVERTRLLRGIKPGYGPPPAYESVYAGSDEQPLMQTSVAVARAYAEAGVGLPEEVRDQPDFIGFELDFLRHLTDKEARAWACGDRGEAFKLLEKERAFLDEHAAGWIPRFCDLMFQDAKLDFYRGVARLTKAFVTDEVRRLVDLQNWARAARAA